MSQSACARATRSLVVLGVLVAGCEAAKIPVPCEVVPELGGLAIGMTRAAVSVTRSLSQDENFPSSYTHVLSAEDRFRALYVTFARRHAVEFKLSRGFSLDELHGLAPMASELRTELVRRLGAPDEETEGARGGGNRRRQFHLAIWRRDCGWIVLVWNTKSDLEAVLANGIYGQDCYVSLSVLTPERGQEFLARYR